MTTSAADLLAARALLAKERAGTLCTAHAGFDGWPFGSVVPYAVGADGDPVVLLASIAEHAKNLAKDPRTTLFVVDSASADDPQAGPRVAVMARAERLDAPAAQTAGATYFARFPSARAYLGSHGFDLYALRVDRVRWIAGFGAMGWFDRGAWAPAADPLAPHAAGICDHMNRDHPDALAVLARRYAGLTVSAATMVGLDAAGLELDAGGTRVRIDFPRRAETPDAVRQVVTSMLGHARPK